MARYLIQAGANVNSQDNAGNTPLHIAAKGGHTGVVNLLLSIPTLDKALCNNKGETPLLLATAKVQTACVDALIAAGVDVDMANADGASPLLMAAWVGDVDLCTKLLEAGANVNHVAMPRGDTPLLLASYREHADVVELLVAHGARTDVCNVRGAVVNGNKSPVVAAAIQRGLELYRHRQRASNIYEHDRKPSAPYGRGSYPEGDVVLDGPAGENIQSPGHYRGSSRSSVGGVGSVVASAASSSAASSPSPARPRISSPSGGQSQQQQYPSLESYFPPKNRPSNNVGSSGSGGASAGSSSSGHERPPARSPASVGYARADSHSHVERKQSPSPPASSSGSPSNGGASSSPTSIEAFMEEEFAKIVGMDSVKDQLRAFYKKVQLDRIREMAGAVNKAQEGRRLYHMVFTGPPGVGKTTMANLVAKVMLKMGLLKTDNVKIVSNAMDLIAGYVGQTPGKVDAKVEEAKGGVLFIDEAYSIVKQDSSKDSFGKEAIDTIMKHLDPPSCVFIFAGYEAEMNRFLAANEGLQRRVPYRYHFEAYTIPQLVEILKVLCRNKDEDLEPGVCECVTHLLETEISHQQRVTQNAGLIANWIAFAQNERDDRLDLEEARRNPDLASLLTAADFRASLPQVKKMAAKSKRAVHQ